MADNSNSSVYIPSTFGANVFELKHNDYNIFYKEFDSENSQVVDVSNDTISIPEHFFKTGELLKYSYPQAGTRIKISPSSPGNTISTDFLPEEVYPIVINSGKIRLAFTKQLALTNQYIDIVQIGIGKNHSFECQDKNSKCLITIDNIIQSPVSASSTVGITNIVNSTTLELSSLENINQGTILKIGEEYTKVISIKYSEDNPGIGTVSLFRSSNVLGTNKITFDANTNVATIMSGQYNIVKNKIYFTDAPFEGKKSNYNILISDLSDDEDSFTIFNTNMKTGSIVSLITQNPPEGLDSERTYFLIKNYENNYSFAENYQDAISGVKVGFTTVRGQYNKEVALEPFILSFYDISGGSSFSGRVFLRSDYSGNKVFDDISPAFNGITSSFELKSSGISTTGIADDNGVVLVNNIFQYPGFDETFSFDEGPSSTDIVFIGNGTNSDPPKDYDVNVKGFPRGGIIVGYGLSGGTNYQPLRGAALYETVKIESNGSYVINNSNIGIAYSGSGYRYSPGYAVSVTFEQNGERISGFGTATITNGTITAVDIIEECTYVGAGSTPAIKITPPFSYENLTLTGSTYGVGAKVTVNISDSGEIGNLVLANPGYGYTVGEVLSVPDLVGNPDQVATDQLKILVLSLGKDQFSAWNIGKLRKLDDLTPFVNGSRKTFSLYENSELVSLEAYPGSDIDIAQNVLIFVNDVLQIPGDSYIFEGGTQIVLSEAPPVGSTLKVYFYEGSTGDSQLVDIDSPVKIGDRIVVKKNLEKNPETQSSRTVKKILSSDTLRTEIYNKRGLSYDSSTYRSIDFTPQSTDLIIAGEYVSKQREYLESRYVGFTSIATRLGTFSVAQDTTIGIDTTGLAIGDYINSTFTDNYRIITIGSGEIGITTNAINSSPVSSPVSIWRKI